MMKNWPETDPEEDDRDDAVDDYNHDSDFPIFELPVGELNERI